MSTTADIERDSARARRVSLAVLLVVGCQALKSKEQSPSGPGSVRFDVPAGTRVEIDGNAAGVAPLDPKEVQPGKHSVKLTSACGQEATVDVDVAAEKTVDVADVAELPVATLNLAVTVPKGSPEDLTLTLGEQTVPAAPVMKVPACKLRIRVAAKDWGGFIEDIDFEAGKTYSREIALAPGPDMVRIHGGKFRLGPPGKKHYDPKHEAQPGEGFYGWPWIPTFDVDVATFELDKTEVTAGQMQACNESGGCDVDAGKFSLTHTPRDDAACTLRHATPPQRKYFVLKAVQGLDEHPANCVARWEAEQYCKWAGKRLPTDVEWEYAARSGRSDYACPWGITPNDSGEVSVENCARRKRTKRTQPVLAFPEDDSEQGVSDLMGSLCEFVNVGHVPGRAAVEGENECRGSSFDRLYPAVPFDDGYAPDRIQDPVTGFRCARDPRDLHGLEREGG